MTDIWKISFKLPPTGWGWGKSRFLDHTLTLTNHISATKHDISNSKVTCQSTGLHAPNLINFEPETAENGWRFCPPPTFLLWETLPALPHERYKYSRQQAYFGTCYVVSQAYSLEHQNAGQAQAGLCHASSFLFLNIWMHLKREFYFERLFIASVLYDKTRPNRPGGRCTEQAYRFLRLWLCGRFGDT